MDVHRVRRCGLRPCEHLEPRQPDGYRFDTPYVPSGHVARILAQRHRCLGKKTAAGEVTVFPLHDENSNYYADADDVSLATPAVLTGRDGNVWMYEPHYWCKGVNDLLNQKKYAFFSSDAEWSGPSTAST